MRRIWTGLIVAAALAACAGPQTGGPRNRPLSANPSAIIAAELAFARLAQDKGQWTAFRETAHKDAVMFEPRRQKAADWLAGKANPAVAVTWQPHAVYVSCDGSAGATTGAWQMAGGVHGYFSTIWLRGADGRFRWVLDHGVPIDGAPRAEPEFIASKQAVCGTRPAIGLAAGGVGDDLAVGVSADQTLSWTSLVRADGSRRITIRQWDGSAMAAVIDDDVAAGKP